jgi:hypothetical protein
VDSNQVSSLRRQVEKWLMRAPDVQLRLTRVMLRNRRCVRAEMAQKTGSFVIYFFQHDDRSWGVVPPSPVRPTMRAYQEVASWASPNSG